MATALYLDTSAALRAVLEGGTTPEIEKKIGAASTLITSRLALVEAGRVFHRIRTGGEASEEQLADLYIWLAHEFPYQIKALHIAAFVVLSKPV